jgi:hypothetical protein
MTEFERLVDQYCEGWSCPAAEAREALIRGSLTDDATYTDPRADHLNVPELLDHIAKIQESRPGAKIVRTSVVDSHHGLARFHWHVALPDGTTLPEGIDVIELSADGTRIRSIIGFFGPLGNRPATHT